jgi:hypothetical protein
VQYGVSVHCQTVLFVVLVMLCLAHPLHTGMQPVVLRLQAMDAVAVVLSGLQQQLQSAGMPQVAAAGQSQQLAVEPLLMLLQEDLRRELRQQICQALCCRGALADADIEATLLHQEHLVVLQCWPLVRIPERWACCPTSAMMT